MATSRDADEAFRTGSYDKAIGLYFDFLVISKVYASSPFDKLESCNVLFVRNFLDQFPRDFRAWLNMGIALGRINRPKDSIKCFERALELDRGSVEAWYNLGLALHALGRNEEEIRCYDRALELGPWNQLSVLRKVEALRLIGREEEAGRLFGEFMSKRRNELQEAAK